MVDKEECTYWRNQRFNILHNKPTQFFETNDWKTPTHDVQESTSQLFLKKILIKVHLTVAYNNKKRQFYRDTISASEEANGVLRWTAATQCKGDL